MSTVFDSRGPSISLVRFLRSWYCRSLWKGLAAAFAVGGALALALLQVIGGRPLESKPFVSVATSGPAPIAGSAALDECVRRLAEAHRLLAGINAIACRFEKREQIGLAPIEPHVMNAKLRRQPAAVYLHWQTPDAGREIIWQADQSGGQILAHPGGWRRKLVPIVKLDPTSDRAMADSHRPVSSMGMWNFCQRLEEFVAGLGQLPGELTVESVQATLGEMACDCFQFTRPRYSPDFQRVRIYIDRGLRMPVALEQYQWSSEAGGEPWLYEQYVFSEIRLNAPLSELDFQIANPAYAYEGR